MATFQELLAQARASQQTPTWGVTDQSTGQWNPYDTAGVAPARDDMGNLAQGVEQRNVGMTSQQAVDQLLYGPGGEFVKGTLASIASAAGLPADFDWTPYLTQAAEQHYQKYGQGYDGRNTNHAHPIAAAVQNAAAANPQLAPFVAQVAPGSQVWTQGQQMMEQRREQAHDSRVQDVTRLGAVAAAPFAAAAGTAAFGAGAGGAAGSGSLAAASDAAMAAGATGGAAGTAGGGLTALQAAGGLNAAGAAGLAGQAAVDIGAGGALAPTYNAGIGAGTTGAVGGLDPALAAGATGGAAGTSGGGITAAQAAGTVAGGSSAGIGNILGGTGTLPDYLKVAGQVLPSLISAYGSQRQADAQSDLADRYFGMGAPYRSRLASLYDDPSAFLSSPEVQIPVQQGTDATARALSTGGNPAGSGRALQEIQNYSANQLFGRLGQEKDRLAGFGGLSGYNAAAPGAANNAINAQGQVYGDLGYGAGQVLNPQQTSLQALLRQYNLSQGLA